MTIATDKWNLPKPETNEYHTLANFNALLDAIDAAVFSVTPMTEVQRDALAGTELWTGRVIYNTDSALGEDYDGAADLAVALEVSRQTVNAIETGKYDPSLPLAFRLARLFGLPIEEIFEDQAGL